MQDSSLLFAAPFVEDLYEQYLQDPASITGQWREYFDALPSWDKGAAELAHSPIQRSFESLPNAAGSPDSDYERKQVKVLQLINAHRFLGCVLPISIRSIVTKSRLCLNSILPITVSLIRT